MGMRYGEDGAVVVCVVKMVEEVSVRRVSKILGGVVI